MANAKKLPALHRAADKVGDAIDSAKRKRESALDALADFGRSRPVEVAKTTVGVAAGVGIAGLLAYGLSSLGEAIVSAASV